MLADGHGGLVHCFERECSIQRRHQKIIEECPSPAVDPGLRGRMGAAALAAAKAVGYLGAGTVEFVLEPSGGFLVPRGQHPAAGGAPGHRGGHRARPGPRAASRGAGPAAVGHPGRPGDQRPRDRGPAVRRGPRRRVPARHRDPGRLVPGHGAAVPLGYRGGGGQRGRGRVRPDAGQGHRARADPRPRPRSPWPWPCSAAGSGASPPTGTSSSPRCATPISWPAAPPPSFIERSAVPLARRPAAAELRTAAIGAALAAQAAARAAAPVLATLPSGWRNTVMPPEQAVYRHGAGHRGGELRAPA